MSDKLNKYSPLFKYAFYLGTAFFVLLYLWANFCNRQVFNLDMQSDAQVARLMWEQKTLFPENWVFGNQYYIVATPVLSALFYGLCGDSILAMGFATTTMLFIQLALFLWLVKPYTGKTGAAAGLFAFGGAVILGTSVCNSTSGMQLLYTMASYYACYMIGILLVLGVYMRLKDGLPVNRLMPAAAILMCFGLGMQSVRETLVLIVPLVLVELLLFISDRRKQNKNRRRSIFVAALTAANVAGLLLMRLLPVVSNKSISGFALPMSPAELLANAASSLTNLSGIMGFQYLEYSIKWKPLFVLALLICAVSLAAVIKAAASLPGRKLDGLGFLILFSVLSLSAVFTVGTFLGFRLRSIYYFVWFLLTSLSFVYLIEKIKKPAIKNLLMLALLGCGAVNLFYNAYPDFAQHKAQQELFYGTAQKLIDMGVDCTYVEYTTYSSSAVAACSDDRIESAIVRLAEDPEGGYCLEAYPHLVDMTLFEEDRKENAVVILTDAHMIGTSSFATLKNYPGSEESLMEKLELISVESNEYFSLYIYKIKDPSVIR